MMRCRFESPDVRPPGLLFASAIKAGIAPASLPAPCRRRARSRVFARWP